MEQLVDLYADFATVLRTAPHGDAVLSGLLLPYNSLSVPVADILGMPYEESIDSKLAAGAYNSLDSEVSGPELLFHDLKLAFGRIVGEWPQDSPEYQEVTRVFKFAIDLLVREANRLRLTKVAPNSGDQHLLRISQGFDVISTEVQDWNNETFWVTAANGPMFMSVPSKAPVDPRDTVVAGSVHTVKLLPHSAHTPESTLGFVSPLNPRLPQPDTPPTNMLSGFRHPDDSGIVPPLWISGASGYSSFAPTSDSNNAVVALEDAAAVWMAKAGYTADPKVQKLPHAVVEGATAGEGTSSGEGAASGVSETNTNDSSKESSEQPLEGSNGTKVENDADVSMNDSIDPHHSDAGASHDLTYYSEESVPDLNADDLEMLLKWTPQSFVDDDEIEAAKNGTERELASSLLLKLQVMQTDRLSSEENADDIPDEERHTAFKVGNVLARLVDGADSKDIALNIDTRLPVLMRNYSGSLPAATDPSLQNQPGMAPPQGSQRLQTIANMRNRRTQRR